MRIHKAVQNENMAVAKSPSGFKEAIGLTTRTIDMRARCFRNLIIGFAIVMIGCVIWTTTLWSWGPLLGLVLLVPLCSAFLGLDTFVVHRWRQQILALWVQEQVELDSFCDTISTIRLLPARTLQSMLHTLPTKNALRNSDKMILSTRKAVALTLGDINLCQIDRTMSSTVAWTVGLVFVAVAMIRWSWPWLLGVLIVIPVLGIGKCLGFLRFCHWKRHILALQREGLKLKNFLEIVARLDWNPISEQKKCRLLTTLAEISSGSPGEQ